MNTPRPTKAYIDLADLRENFDSVRYRVGPECGILAVVKADAYGHGVAGVAPALADAGAEMFGVALVEEAIALRHLGLEHPILILGSAFAGQEMDVLEHGLTPVIYDLSHAQRLNECASNSGRTIDYHLKVDTGMGRLGFRMENLERVLSFLKSYNGLRMSGLMSHLAVADEPERPLTHQQFERFSQVVDQVRHAGFDPTYIHIANSAGIFTRDLAGCNLVRPGISLYGGLTGGPYSQSLVQKPVMQLVSQIAQLKDMTPGEGVSYGHRFVAERPSKIAAVPIGYADGYNRLLTNRGDVLIRGQRVPVAGTVCMDWILVDVTDLPDVALGDNVTLLGTDGAEQITAQEWADKIETITYEVFCGISRRVPRVYLDRE